jgi:LysM repeat protein
MSRFCIIFLLLLLFNSACQGEEDLETPTEQVSDEALAPAPTNTLSIPTATQIAPTIAPTQTSTEPTAEATEAATPRPTVTSPVPTQTPSPEATPVPAPLPEPTFYEIQAGDSLLAIAEQFEVSTEALAIANGHLGIDEFALIAGQEIQIPLCQAHQIVIGNTLSGIASICGLSLDDLVTANIDTLARLGNLASVSEGLVLVIPQESGTPEDIDCILQPERQQVIEYVPQPGEGLFCLLQKFNVSTTAIIQANIDRLVAPNIYGEVPLLIPPLDGAIYVVTSDDVDAAITLESLAEWYELPVDNIFDWNENPASEPLIEGQQLYLPGANLIFGPFRSEPAQEDSEDNN